MGELLAHYRRRDLPSLTDIRWKNLQHDSRCVACVVVVFTELCPRDGCDRLF